MNPFQFDPSKMDPKVLMELSQLVQKLPPSQIQRMQSLMHNMMAGFDVQKDMAEFEKTLPPGFREKLMSIMGSSGASFDVPETHTIQPMSAPHEAEQGKEQSAEMNMREARLTVLKAVADGAMSPEEAERILFQSA